MMESAQFTYRLAEIPDRSYPPFFVKAGGDVRSAVQADCEHLLRALAEFPPDSVSLSTRYLFNPSHNGQTPQERLNIFLSAQAYNEDYSAALSLLLDRGPLRRFYPLCKVESMQIPWDTYQAVCTIARRQILLEPTVTPEFNPKALPAYLMIQSFQPNPTNDEMPLDNFLDRIEEPVLIERRFEPADSSRELALHTRYLSLLQRVNRTWDDEDVIGDPIGSSHAGEWRMALKSLQKKEPLADDCRRRQQRFHETLTQPHLRFQIRIFARSQALARLLGSVIAESAFQEGSYRLQVTDTGESGWEETAQNVDCRPVPPVLDSRESGNNSQLELYRELERLNHLAPVDQLTSVFRLPLAGNASPKTIRKNTDPPAECPDIILGIDEQTANSQTSEPWNPVYRGISIKNLAKHLFIAGMPGSGKTIAIINLLLQLSKLKIPFIVFEPGKAEYRLLKRLKNHPNAQLRQLAQELRVYTPGNERISPWRLNPLQIPPGISTYQHIENLSTCFKAAMPLSAPLPSLLEEALERVYELNPDPDHPPRMADLHHAAERVLAAKGYSAEVHSNIRGGLDTRLGALTRRAMGRIFQCPNDNEAIKQLLEGFSLIELAALPRDHACLVTLFSLMLLRETIASIPYTHEGIRIVIVLEEAHNIVARTNPAAASETNADPTAFASEFVCNMLAELRAHGVAIVIVDQLPSTVAPQVVKNTGSKLAFRQVDTADREDLGGAMLFGPLELEEIARLRPGEAFFMTENYFGPRRIVTPNLQAEFDLPIPPAGDSLHSYLRDEAWFIETAEARMTAELKRLKNAMDEFDEFRTQIVQQTKKLLTDYTRILTPSSQDQGKGLSQCVRKAQTLLTRLTKGFEDFQRGAYRPLLGEEPGESLDSGLHSLRNNAIHRFETVIEPDTQSCLGILRNLLEKSTINE